MRNIFVFIIPLLFFSDCYDFCQDEQRKNALLLIQLNESQNQLDTCIITLYECVRDKDTLQLEKAQLQADLMNCKSTASKNKTNCNKIIQEKSDSIIILTDQLNDLQQDYEHLESEYNKLVNDNYITDKTKVENEYYDVNQTIETNEQYLQSLSTTYPKTEAIIKEMTATQNSLQFDKGIEYSIQLFFKYPNE